MTLREVTVHVRRRGRRTHTLTLETALLDGQTCRKADLADLYRRRGDAELDFYSLKSTLQMDVLRGRTPEMIRKELWAHLLACNAVRLMMAEADEAHDRCPMRSSFSGSLQLLRAFHAAGKLHDPALLAAVAQRQVPHRPDRTEPRAVKRRPKPHPLLRLPRAEARKSVMR